MAEVMERVAQLEGRFDGLASSLADLKMAIARVDKGVLEVRQSIQQAEAGFSARLDSECGAVRCEIRNLRTELHTQFRWIMGGIGGAVLAIVLAIVGALTAAL